MRACVFTGPMRVAHVILSWGALAVPAVVLSSLVVTRCAATTVAPQATAPQTAAPQATAPQTAAVARPPAPPAASSEEDAVRVAVFRYLLGHNASSGQTHVPFVCLEVDRADAAHDPSSFVMAAMRGAVPRVVPGAACEQSSDGVFLKGDHARGRGLVFRTGAVTIDGDRATVDGGYFEGGLSASGNVYTVERQRDGSWRVTKDQMRWIS